MDDKTETERRNRNAPIIMLGGFGLLALLVGGSVAKNSTSGFGPVLMFAGVICVLAAIIIGVVRASSSG